MTKQLADPAQSSPSSELWSIRRLAAEPGFDRDVIKRRLDAAVVQPVGPRAGHPLYTWREAARAIDLGISAKRRNNQSQITARIG